MEEEIPVDVFRQIVSFSTSSRTILDLWSVNDVAKKAIRAEVRKLSKNGPIRVDLRRFFSDANPFQWEFYDLQSKEHKRMLLEKIRELARLLEKLLEIGDKFQIENLTAAALGFQAELDEQYLPRAPFMLQKKLMHILSKFQSESISISQVFMRPSRQIRTFRHRFDQISTLDLGNMKALASCQLRSVVFPSLVNLENLTWNHANHKILHKIPNKDKMKSLNLNCNIVGRPRYGEFMFLKEFENLENFHLGFNVPTKPTRMEMDVLLNLYQAIFSRKMGNLLEGFSKLQKIGFWNVPEKVFKQLSKRELPVDTLTFGSVNQSLSKLCSFDSVTQAFFNFEELEKAVPPPVVKHLDLNLHTMPVVGLDYYLPNLMMSLNDLPNLESVSLLVNCIYQSQMTSSWSLESRKDKMSRKRLIYNMNFTKFELHVDGLCGLMDLDRQLPPSLEVCTISLNLPADSGRKVMSSVYDFIEKLGSLNDFPELVEFHIQILGVKCFEKLVHVIGDYLGPHLQRVSIYAPPQCTDKPIAKRLMTRIAELFPRAVEISLSTDYLKVLLSESAQSSPNWPNKITKMARKYEFDMTKCKISTGRLPRNSNFVPKGEEPRDISEEAEELLIENIDETVLLDDDEQEREGVEKLEDNDWITNDDDDEECEGEEDEFENTEIVYESEEDELEGLERKLTKESDRRHSKWQKKQSRIAVISDDEEEEDPDENKENEEEDMSVVDWDKLSNNDEEEEENEEGEGRHGMFDDEAAESDAVDSDDEEVEGEDEEEEEGESLDDSDDERLFENGPSRKRQIENKKLAAKRRRIVVSDEESDTDF